MIRLVAFDLDGTLMGSDQQIRPAVREAVALTLEKGVTVTLATGRMFSATVEFAKRLNITAPLICYQGGWIQAIGAEVLHRVPLSGELAREALFVGRSHDWHTILYADGELYIDALRHPLSFYEALLGPHPQVVPNLTRVLAAHTADKVLFVAEPNEIPNMNEVLVGRFGNTLEVVQSHECFIEVVPRGVSKGRALAWLADYKGLTRNAVLAAGDQQNDLSMIQWAGVGVAVDNAVEEVKQAADWIAPSVDEDGAAAILYRYVLKEPTT
ncbi:MAG: Cof-type HAD-IIB family hydrolase [Anaerolineae bacterium]